MESWGLLIVARQPTNEALVVGCLVAVMVIMMAGFAIKTLKSL